MPGQKLEREARAKLTGLTQTQRKEYVRRLVNAGYSERQIAKAIGMSTGGTHYLVAEIKGHKRQAVTVAMCEQCWEDKPLTQLNHDRICTECAPQP
jgi:FixJ family two-component response regulator